MGGGGGRVGADLLFLSLTPFPSPTTFHYSVPTLHVYTLGLADKRRTFLITAPFPTFLGSVYVKTSVRRSRG